MFDPMMLVKPIVLIAILELLQTAVREINCMNNLNSIHPFLLGNQ